MGRIANRAAVAGGAWVALLAAALTLSILAAAHDPLPGDERFTSWLQDQPFPGETLSDIVRAMAPTWLLVVTGAAGAALLWLRGYRTEAIVLAAGLVVMALVQAGVKDAVDRPRPSADLVAVRASHDSESFPSGHVMGATYFYGFLIYLSFALPIERAARAALASGSLAVLALMPLSSVWLGLHWPSDTLGGYSWGGVVLLPAIAVCELRRQA
jgi:undecaprenyl-diphosphatase